MNFLTKKISDHPTWVFFAITAVVVVVGIVLYNMFFTQNIVATGNNGSFIKQSLGGPMTAEQKAELAVATDTKLAEKNNQPKKK